MALSARIFSFHLIRLLFAALITFGVSELTFRLYDSVTVLHDNIDVWVRNTSKDLQEHPLLGYRYPPLKVLNSIEQADEFGMPNVTGALQWPSVEVVGIGDSYVHIANRVFFERFKQKNLRYHSLALFGYGPGTYNILMREYGFTLRPKVYLYFVYVGNDPGDVRRHERWLASGKSWYDFNGGYFMPIERTGYFWGWRLFLGRAKEFARNTLSRMDPERYAAIKGLVRKDDAETVFEYVLQAKGLSERQQVSLVVLIIPRVGDHKPFLDPIADGLINLCARNGIDCLDLDPAFGDVKGRGRLFAPDGHWNEAGIEAAWTFLWERKVVPLVASSRN